VVAVIIGSSYLESDFENSILGFKIPENWTVVDVTTNDSIAGLKSLDYPSTIITITSSDISPSEVVNEYIKNYSLKYPHFQVLKNEPVTVDGVNGTILVFKNKAINDTLFTGPDYFSSVVAFSKNNQTYIIISNEVNETDYTTLVEPAINSLVKSLRIKGY
jgi:hypothetical protein